MEQFRRSATFDRQQFLKPTQYPHGATPTPAGADRPKFKPTFILTYNPHNPPISRWFDKYQNILLSDPKMKQIFPKKPSVVFRQAPNLKRKLTKSAFRALPFPDGGDTEDGEAGCYKYRHQGRGRPCETCPKLNVSTTFTSKFTGRTYKMRYRLNCKSTFVVYLVTCPRQGCPALYTGSTTKTIMARHGGHRQEIREKGSNLGIHFSQCGYENFSLQLIDCVKEGEVEALGRLEGYWQHNLATFVENGGINRRDEMTRQR